MEMELDDYHELAEEIEKKVAQIQSSTARFQSIKERVEKKSEQHVESIILLQTAKYCINWRGINMMKDSREMIVYTQILWELKPKTIIELGTYLGGSSVWLADTMRAYKLPCHVYTVDIDAGLIDQIAKDDCDVTCVLGDANKLEEEFTEEMVKNLPHPWLIIEDCHINVIHNMEYFAKYMEVGDYFAIEDTSPHVTEYGLIDIPFSAVLEQKIDGLRGFLNKHDEQFKVDSYFTDLFGFNGTNTWDGYIKKVK